MRAIAHQKIRVQLSLEGFVAGLWEKGFLLKDGKKAHGLLKHVDTLLQIHAKVDVGPILNILYIS